MDVWSHLRDKVPTVELRRRLGNEGVVEVMRLGRLRWFGHVERKEVDDSGSACRNLEVAGSRGRGRPKMTWRARLDDWVSACRNLEVAGSRGS